MADTTHACPTCASLETAATRVDHTFIRHLDFTPMRNQAQALHKCQRCQTIFMADPGMLEEIGEIYDGSEYAHEKKTEHVVYSANERARDDGTFTTAYSVMADLVAEQATSQAPRVLDVGCFDGKLLLELDKRFENPVLHGFDVTEYIGKLKLFPEKENFRYFTGDLSSVDGSYDIISLLNVLAYVDNIPDLMEHLRRLLAPGGVIFVASINAQKNAYSLTCGDQFYYSTPINLRNLFGIYGFSTGLQTDHPAFPRSILAACRRDEGAGDYVFEPDDTLDAAVLYLAGAVQRIKSLVKSHVAGAEEGRFCVLGCLNNAAWAYNQVGDAIDCFADENPHRVGSTFYGQPVVHPESLEEQDILVVPYGETAAPIVDKFSRLYKPRLIAI